MSKDTLKPMLVVTSLKTDGAVFIGVQPIPLLPLLKTDGLPVPAMKPSGSVADLKTDGLSIFLLKPMVELTSLKTAGDLLECSLGIDTPSKQVAQHTCDAIAKLGPIYSLHRTYNATGFEADFEFDANN